MKLFSLFLLIPIAKSQKLTGGSCEICSGTAVCALWEGSVPPAALPFAADFPVIPSTRRFLKYQIYPESTDVQAIQNDPTGTLAQLDPIHTIELEYTDTTGSCQVQVDGDACSSCSVCDNGRTTTDCTNLRNGLSLVCDTHTVLFPLDRLETNNDATDPSPMNPPPMNPPPMNPPSPPMNPPPPPPPPMNPPAPPSGGTAVLPPPPPPNDGSGTAVLPNDSGTAVLPPSPPSGGQASLPETDTPVSSPAGQASLPTDAPISSGTATLPPDEETTSASPVLSVVVALILVLGNHV